jgi:hypothetical protein
MNDDVEPVAAPRPQRRPGPSPIEAEPAVEESIAPEAPIEEPTADELPPVEESAHEPVDEPTAEEDDRPDPEPTSAPETPAVEPEGEPEAAAEPEGEPEVAAPPVAPGPVSAASRARRIGGRPIPASGSPAPSVDGSPVAMVKRRPAPPPPGVGRHLAVPPTAPKTERVKKERQPKAEKEPKAEKAPKTGTETRLVPWIPSIVLSAAALVLVVFVAIAAHGVYYGKGSVSTSQRNEYQEQALAAAKTCLATINTYDYRKLDADEKAALACTTGTFTASLKETFEKTLKVKAPPAKVVQTAQVNEAGISEVTGNAKQIQILIYGQLTITNVSTGTTPQYDPFGVVVTVDKIGGNWLIASYVTPTGS